MYRFRGASLLLAFVAILGAALLPPSAAEAKPKVRTYLAIGDSIAYGETNILPVSYGDQGYVRLYADYLAEKFDGVRPLVINLGVPGETSTSFFTATPPPGFLRQPLVNLNYTSESQSQYSKLLAAIAAEKQAGHVITHVSFALGANDFLALASSPEFNAPGANQPLLVQQMLQRLLGNYAVILTQLRALLPHAKILLLNYHNPFAVFGPSNPLNQLSIEVLQAHSAMVKVLAKRFKGRFVDIYTPFLGHEAEYTHIMEIFVGLPVASAIHPNTVGYAVIAQQMIGDDD